MKAVLPPRKERKKVKTAIGGESGAREVEISAG